MNLGTGRRDERVHSKTTLALANSLAPSALPQDQARQSSR